MKKMTGCALMVNGRNIKLIFAKICSFSTTGSFVLSLLLFTFVIILYPAGIQAQQQEEEPPADVAPPPLRSLSVDEKKMLEAENGSKKRTQVSLDLMEARITKSEKLIVDNNFRDSLEELGRFQGLLDNTLDYLEKNNNGSNKIDNNFKSLEIYLRKQVPRLETIRREMPFKYSYYVQRLMRAVREARAKAIEPLFRDTVVPNNKP